MTTTNTPLDNVIEHATETTKAANERVREFAQIGVRKADRGLRADQQGRADRYGRDEHPVRPGARRRHQGQPQAARGRQGRRRRRLRRVCATSCRQSPVEAFDIIAKYWRGRLETRIAQAQDLGAFARKVADDAVRPVQERIEKFTKAAA